jgi:transposase
VAVTQLLQRYEREGAEFLDSVVTCDETWVHYFTRESKRASKQCKHAHSPPLKKKAKAIFSAGKIMTANAQYYSTLLNEKVKSAIRLKRRKRQDSVFFLQDNARPHTATLMVATPLKLKWDVLPHPPYSPDLAPSDDHLFGSMKRVLGSKRFRNNDEVIAAVQSWIHKQPKPSLKLELRSFQNVGTSVWQSTGTALKSSV